MKDRGPILIVDDNASNLKLARVTLELAGFEIAVAADAEQARAAVRALRPRLILMDIQLPGTDGLTLTRELKADASTAGIRIVALSAYAMKGDEQKARAAGCDGYISKPIDTRALPGQVEGYLSRGSERPRLLLVEDDPSFGKLLRIGLQNAGFDVALTADIDEARAALAAGLPSLIVIDGWLRVAGDGLSFCHELKRGAATRALPVVMLSGSPDWPPSAADPDGPDLSLTKAPEVLAGLPEKIRELLAARAS